MLVLALARLASAQVQVELKFSRLQYIAYEPLLATVAITNRAGRDIELRNADGQEWFGFEVTRNEGEAVSGGKSTEMPPLRIATGQTVMQKINLTPLFPMDDAGNYHVRAHVYFADLNRYFYSQARVVEVTSARPVWKQSVGLPDAPAENSGTRTYSLMTNRFSDHTSLYVRVEDETRGLVYATYPLGRIISFDEPHAEIDRANNLHVLYCAAPRTWSYAEVGLNGELLAHSTILETTTRPHFRRSGNGDVVLSGGVRETAAAAQAVKNVPKLSSRPAGEPSPAKQPDDGR